MSSAEFNILEEKIDALDKKIDRILNTFGLREQLSREERHKVDVMSKMSLEDLKAQSRAISREMRGKRR